MFLKGCKYIEKKVIAHINDNNLSDFSFSDESDEEQMFLINTLVGCFFSFLLTDKHAYKV